MNVLGEHGFAGLELTEVNSKPDVHSFVRMNGGADVVGDAGVDTQFFFKFSFEGSFGGFAWFDFPARKLPQISLSLAVTALGSEDGAVAKNGGTNYINVACHGPAISSRR